MKAGGGDRRWESVPKERDAGEKRGLQRAYLATPPGGDALLRAGARERLGRDVQHPGPLARALPGVRLPTPQLSSTPVE